MLLITLISISIILISSCKISKTDIQDESITAPSSDTGTLGEETQENSGETSISYTDKEKNFTIHFPKEWQGKYTIEETGNIVQVLHKNDLNIKCLLFGIRIVNKNNPIKENEKMLYESNNKVFTYISRTDEPYDYINEENKDIANKLKKAYEEIKVLNDNDVLNNITYHTKSEENDISFNLENIKSIEIKIPKENTNNPEYKKTLVIDDKNKIKEIVAKFSEVKYVKGLQNDISFGICPLTVEFKYDDPSIAVVFGNNMLFINTALGTGESGYSQYTLPDGLEKYIMNLQTKYRSN